MHMHLYILKRRGSSKIGGEVLGEIFMSSYEFGFRDHKKTYFQVYHDFCKLMIFVTAVRQICACTLHLFIFHKTIIGLFGWKLSLLCRFPISFFLNQKNILFFKPIFQGGGPNLEQGRWAENFEGELHILGLVSRKT